MIEQYNPEDITWMIDALHYDPREVLCLRELAGQGKRDPSQPCNVCDPLPLWVHGGDVGHTKFDDQLGIVRDVTLSAEQYAQVVQAAQVLGLQVWVTGEGVVFLRRRELMPVEAEVLAVARIANRYRPVESADRWLHSNTPHITFCGTDAPTLIFCPTKGWCLKSPSLGGYVPGPAEGQDLREWLFTVLCQDAEAYVSACAETIRARTGELVLWELRPRSLKGMIEFPNGVRLYWDPTGRYAGWNYGDYGPDPQPSPEDVSDWAKRCIR